MAWFWKYDSTGQDTTVIRPEPRNEWDSAMRVGFNALLLSNQPGYRQSGFYRYLYHLLQSLPDAMTGDEMVEAWVPAGVELPSHDPRLQAHPASKSVEGARSRILYEQTVLPFSVRRAKVDLFHGPTNTLPSLPGTPSVVTIHDLAFLHWPELVPGFRRRYLSMALPRAAKSADRIIAVSEATRKDIVQLLGVESGKITVIPLGIDPEFSPAIDEENSSTPKRSSSRPYLLTVGTLEPRKNLDALIYAFASIVDQVPHDLVLVGGPGWRTDEIDRAAALPELEGRVQLAGFVEQADLPGWYRGADAFVFPSLYEGFGLPLLESMASGTPAVVSNVGSLPEIGGDAAGYFDPYDREAISQSLLRVLTDESWRAELSEKGKARAAEFSWNRTASATVEVYREILK